METMLSRRSFLKCGAAAVLAVGAAGMLGGCDVNGGTEVSPTEIILGDYKVDIDMKKSVLGKNGDGSATVKPSVWVTNMTGGAVTTPFMRSVFPSMTAGETELKAGNSKTDVLTLAMKVPTEVNPSFLIEDADVYKKINEGELDLKLTVKLSGQTAVYTLNFGSLTKTVEKI